MNSNNAAYYIAVIIHEAEIRLWIKLMCKKNRHISCVSVSVCAYMCVYYILYIINVYINNVHIIFIRKTLEENNTMAFIDKDV